MSLELQIRALASTSAASKSCEEKKSIKVFGFKKKKKNVIWEISPRAENDLSKWFSLVLRQTFFLCPNILLKFGVSLVVI